MGCKFDMSELCKLSYYLGIEVEQGKGYIQLKQTGYARKTLKKAGMDKCNPTKYLMDPKEVIHMKGVYQLMLRSSKVHRRSAISRAHKSRFGLFY